MLYINTPIEKNTVETAEDSGVKKNLLDAATRHRSVRRFSVRSDRDHSRLIKTPFDRLNNGYDPDRPNPRSVQPYCLFFFFFAVSSVHR